MKSYFADALQLLIHGDFGNFEKLLKQHPELLEIKAGKRSLLTFAVLNDRLRPAQYLHKYVCFNQMTIFFYFSFIYVQR